MQVLRNDPPRSSLLRAEIINQEQGELSLLALMAFADDVPKLSVKPVAADIHWLDVWFLDPIFHYNTPSWGWADCGESRYMAGKLQSFRHNQKVKIRADMTWPFGIPQNYHQSSEDLQNNIISTLKFGR